MGIPYQGIGIGVGIILGISALFTAETPKSKLTILITMIVLFFLPAVWRHKSASIVAFLGWIVFGISCYLFIKFQRVGL